MIWQERVIKWATISGVIGAGITFVLVTMMLLPSILNGPDNVHILVRSKCHVNEIRYLDNLCSRDTSQDFSNLIYREDWEVCKVVEVVASSDLVLNNDAIKNCTWKFPGNFQSEKDAFVAISGDYYEGVDYDCVVDTVNKICYPDKMERLIFGLSVGGLVLVFFASIGGYFYGKRWVRLKKEAMEKLERGV